MRLRIVLAATPLLAGCAGDTLSCREMLRAELFFGRNAGSGLRVSDAEWRDFAAGPLSARFPGFTVLDATGFWRGEQEPSKLVLVIAENSPATRAALIDVASEYKSRFAQESVLFAATSTCAAF